MRATLHKPWLRAHTEHCYRLCARMFFPMPYEEDEEEYSDDREWQWNHRFDDTSDEEDDISDEEEDTDNDDEASDDDWVTRSAGGEQDDPGKDVDRCVFCCAAATLSCRRCEDEFYCGALHRKDHREDHKKVCVPKASPKAQDGGESSQALVEAQDETSRCVPQDSPLLDLPEEVLLHICSLLHAADLVRLGWVCSSLHFLCRGTRAWSNVKFPEREDSSCERFVRMAVEERKTKEEEAPRLNKYGVLRIAPALHTLTLDGWPAVNLLRYTNNVKVFEFEWDGDELVEDSDKSRLYHTLRHYRRHLQRVKLACLHETNILHLIDGMEKIQELYVGRDLVKVYPGCAKTITSLKLGASVSGRVAAAIVRANRDNLTSFIVDSDTKENRWARDYYKSALYRELARCTGLRKTCIPTWGKISIIDKFPELRTLSIYDFGEEGHSAVKRFFEASQVVRGLHNLSLGMGYQAHRGLIQVVATSCSSLRSLRLVYRNSGRMDFAAGHVDMPRDLHVILGLLGDLEHLTLTMARVPSTVFTGMAAGALPYLTQLTLNACAVTQKGRTALEAMQAQRQDLTVKGAGKKLARANAWAFPDRCTKTICRARSVCDDEDPVSEVEDPGDSSDMSDDSSDMDDGVDNSSDMDNDVDNSSDMDDDVDNSSDWVDIGSSDSDSVQ